MGLKLQIHYLSLAHKVQDRFGNFISLYAATFDAYGEVTF